MSASKLKAVRGMNDVLPDDMLRWTQLEAILAHWLKSFGYQALRMPIVEPTALFTRAIGEVTDIVEKEMYSFTDALNGEALTLRPEGTASCVRAVIEHNLLARGAQRLWYMGAMFRHERPQKGRYRQFHQLGVEALGLAGPDVDAELIVMAARLWRLLGLEDDITLELNSLGDSEERARHRAALVTYFETHRAALDEDSQRRLARNPLRILDSKNPDLQTLIEQAPRLFDFLGAESRAHFDGLTRLLEAAGIGWHHNHRLVRGLDYYNRSVFEWVTTRLGAQGTVCAGGRYDGLVAQLGGKAAPAAGFAMGLERLLLLWQEGGYVGAPAPWVPAVYITHVGDEASALAFRVAGDLRDRGLDVVLHVGGGGFRSQFKKADASGALLALVIGEEEARSAEVGIKFMRIEREQERVAVTALGDFFGCAENRQLLQQAGGKTALDSTFNQQGR